MVYSCKLNRNVISYCYNFWVNNLKIETSNDFKKVGFNTKYGRVKSKFANKISILK